MDEQTSLPGSISYHPITIRILIGLIWRHAPPTLFPCFPKARFVAASNRSEMDIRIVLRRVAAQHNSDTPSMRGYLDFPRNCARRRSFDKLQSRCSDHCTVCLRLCIASHGAFSEVASAMQVPHDAENKPWHRVFFHPANCSLVSY